MTHISEFNVLVLNLHQELSVVKCAQHGDRKGSSRASHCTQVSCEAKNHNVAELELDAADMAVRFFWLLKQSQ